MYALLLFKVRNKEYIVNVFSHNGKGGNKAGVVRVKEDISKVQCQK
ncbi:hypothetical protein HS141_17430 [Cetobacterium somerae]|nr:hypothetical protein [Cetobacterium somerae]MCQ9628636.1 hypothetical protein [Cetobacterium somerae]